LIPELVLEFVLIRDVDRQLISQNRPSCGDTRVFPNDAGHTKRNSKSVTTGIAMAIGFEES